MRIAALAIALLVASGPALADETAKGKFQSQSVSFNLGGAIAFRGTSSFNRAEPAIIVAVSNQRLMPTLSDYLDRRRREPDYTLRRHLREIGGAIEV